MLIGQLLFKKFNITTLVHFFSIGVVAGVYLSDLLSLNKWYLFLGLILLPTLRRRDFSSILICFSVGLFIALARTDSVTSSIAPLVDLKNQKVELIATATDDGSYDSKKRIAFIAKANKIIYPIEKNIDAPIKVNTFLTPGVMKGDVLRINGKLYSGFGSSVASIPYAEIETIGTKANFLDNLRNNFVAKLRNVIPEPQASFASGLLIGQKTGLSEDLQDYLRKAGLTHIIAVSGYNLTVIVRIIRRIFGKTSRFQIFALSYLSVILFVGITGMSPSILRAFIVTTILIFGWYLGRKTKPLTLFLIAVAISALIEPFQLLNSVGWYLSFGAFFGVIIIAPQFISRLRKPTLWKSILIESFCAGIMTLPIIAITFSKISLTGVLINSIVVPLVPLAMILSLISGLGSCISEGFGAYLAIPANYLLKFILDFAENFSKWPGTDIEIKVQALSVIFFYASVALCMYLMYRRNPVKDVLQ